ncbi:hypothetical protein GMJAKD_17825 [Candidatus Electrothrix aarhusensis]
MPPPDPLESSGPLRPTAFPPVTVVSFRMRLPVAVIWSTFSTILLPSMVYPLPSRVIEVVIVGSASVRLTSVFKMMISAPLTPAEQPPVATSSLAAVIASVKVQVLSASTMRVAARVCPGTDTSSPIRMGNNNKNFCCISMLIFMLSSLQRFYGWIR